MKAFCFVALSVLGLVSCKTQSTYNKVAYEEIMNNSVQLHALEQKGRVHPGIISNSPDTIFISTKPSKSTEASLNKIEK